MTDSRLPDQIPLTKEERIAAISADVEYAWTVSGEYIGNVKVEDVRWLIEQVRAASKDSERLTWLEEWLPLDPNRRLLTWDRSGKEFTLFRNDEDRPRLGMQVDLRAALDNAKARA